MTKGVEVAGRPFDVRARSYNPSYPEKPGIIDGNISDEWKRQRNNALNILKNLGWGKSGIEGRIQEQSRDMIDKLREIGTGPYYPDHLISLSVTNIICALLFDKRFDYDDPELKHLLQTLYDLFQGFIGETDAHVMPIVKHFPFVKKAMKDLFDKGKAMQTFYQRMIEEGRKKLASGEEPSDFITHYLQEMEKTEAKIKEDWLHQLTSDFFMAGAETTATTLTWSLLYMAVYPAVQKKVQAELDETFGKGQYEFSLSDRDKVPYTDATVMEIQRITAIAGIAIPHMAVKDASIGGYVIPKGTEVYSKHMIYNLPLVHLTVW